MLHAHNNAGIRNAISAGVCCVEHGSAIDEETAVLMAERRVVHVLSRAVVRPGWSCDPPQPEPHQTMRRNETQAASIAELVAKEWINGTRYDDHRH